MDDFTPYIPIIQDRNHVTAQDFVKYSGYLQLGDLSQTKEKIEVPTDTTAHCEGQANECQQCTRSMPCESPVTDEKLRQGVLNPVNFPLMAETLQGLPPSYILTVESDTLRDDGMLYKQRLQAEGVTVVHDHSLTGFHGMITFPHIVDAAQETVDNIVQFIDEYS